jgi:hypothetical protein
MRRYRALLAQWVDDEITDDQFVDKAYAMNIGDKAIAAVMDSKGPPIPFDELLGDVPRINIPLHRCAIDDMRGYLVNTHPYLKR